ncbi:hypothetical protein Bbelb_007560 [Branchiostoma belcheri]|nr:hypothetical protein Bbelb_007560 [Branchiostoma belcheri]
MQPAGMYSTGHEIRIKFCGTYRDIPQDVPQYSAGRPAIFRMTFRNLTHGVPQSYARRSAILRTAFCGHPRRGRRKITPGRNKLLSSNNLQAVSLGGVSTLLRPVWWAGPRLRAVIGAPERHVVCGARESTSAAAATCCYYGDVRGNARPNSVANEMY